MLHVPGNQTDFKPLIKDRGLWGKNDKVCTENFNLSRHKKSIKLKKSDGLSICFEAITVHTCTCNTNFGRSRCLYACEDQSLIS